MDSPVSQLKQSRSCGERSPAILLKSLWKMDGNGMATAENSLASFLAPGMRPSGVDLCLPEFSGSLSAPLQTRGNEGYGYPSSAFSNRDVRSAFHVQSLLSQHFSDDSIRLQSPGDFMSTRSKEWAPRVGILFGSRSNEALSKESDLLQLERLVSFEFGAEWSIVGQDERRFSIADPSKLSREDYEATTDYCVVARVRDDRGRPLFLIAGLGGRATEGGGKYLVDAWEKLHRRFESRDFAVVLAFAPPVNPDHSTEAASYVAESLPT